MTFKINVKIDYKEAEVEGYGLIKVRPMGAGEQLELNQLQRELEEFQEPIDELKDAEENEENREKIQRLTEKMSATVKKIHELITSCITSDDPTVAARMKKELPIDEISRISAEILKNA